MLMIGNDLYVFKSQYIGIYDTAAVDAVKRAAVPEQARKSRLSIFTGATFQFGGDLREYAAGKANLTMTDPQF